MNESARFDGPAGSQLVDSAADAVASYLRSPVANAHGGFPPSDNTDAFVAGARSAVAELFGTAAENVAFGSSMTALSYMLADAVSDSVGAGDEILGTSLDHEANVSPWRDLAERRGASFRIVEPDRETLDLTSAHMEAALSDRTRWLAITAASNASGSIPDLAAIVELAHQAGARVVVDAVHAAPHLPISFDELGADAMLMSAYKWFGPHGSMLLLSPQLRDSLHPLRLRGAPPEGVDQWERGSLSFEAYPGIEAAAGYLSETGLERVREVEAPLGARLLAGLQAIPNVTVYGEPTKRTSTVLFNVADLEPSEVARELRNRGVYLWHGHFYALELMSFLGISGAVRAGILHYNTAEEIDRLLLQVETIASGKAFSVDTGGGE